METSLESLALMERAHPGKGQGLMPGTPIRAVPDIEGREEKPTEPHGDGGQPRTLACPRRQHLLWEHMICPAQRLLTHSEQ